MSGFRLAALALLGCLTATILVWGALVVSHHAAGSFFWGYVALAVAIAVIVLNVRAWIKMLPGVLALGALNALIMAASGHVLNNPSALISRSMAVGSAIALAVAAVISAHFDSKHLTFLDRAVLVIYVGFVLLGRVTGWVLVSFELGAVALAIPWATGRLRHIHS